VLTYILTNRIFVSIATSIRFASLSILIGFASIAASFSPLLQ
jgi:hypothetical protein